MSLRLVLHMHRLIHWVLTPIRPASDEDAAKRSFLQLVSLILFAFAAISWMAEALSASVLPSVTLTLIFGSYLINTWLMWLTAKSVSYKSSSIMAILLPISQSLISYFSSFHQTYTTYSMLFVPIIAAYLFPKYNAIKTSSITAVGVLLISTIFPKPIQPFHVDYIITIVAVGIVLQLFLRNQRKMQADLNQVMLQRQEQLQLFFDANPSGILVLEKNGRIISANRTILEFLEMDEPMVRTKSIYDLVIDEDRESLYEATAAMLQHAREPITIVSHMLDRTLSRISIRIRINSFIENEVIRFLAVLEDITHIEEMEESLAEAQQQNLHRQKLEAMGTLSGGIAHDFNNIMSVIKGYAEILEGTIKDQLQLDMVEEIQKAVDRASAVTLQLLKFSKKDVMQPEVVDLNELLLTSNNMLRMLLKTRITLEMQLPDRSPSVFVDKNQLQQVLMNLVMNGGEAIPHEGSVNIQMDTIDDDKLVSLLGLDSSKSYVKILVSDTGEGIPEKVLPQIFDPFYTTKESGSGLGLHTTFQIIKDSKGEILVNSQVGRGTTFTIILPVYEHEAIQPLTAELLENCASLNGMTFMVIEDEPAIRSIIKRMLVREGVEVITAEDGVIALETERSITQHLDLIITDINLPRLNGIDVIQIVSSRRPQCPYLFISGYTESTLFHDAQLNDSIPFLQKPFSKEVFLAKIREVLAEPLD